MKPKESHASRTPLREGEIALDRLASPLDVHTDISFRETLRVFLRVFAYFGLFKARIVAKLVFISIELAFRLMIVVWPAKIVVDHVILGQPIAEGIPGFPAYFAPFLRFLDGMGPLEIMLWITLLGALMVIVFGSSTSGGWARSRATASLAQGHDIATQTENEANRAGSQMGGILGLIDFGVHLRLSQSLNHLLRTQLAGRIEELPMTTLDDQRIGDSVYRVLYDTTSASLLLEGLTLGLYSGILGVVISLVMLIDNYGNAPEVILLGLAGFPITLLLVLPLARVARRRSQASRAAGSRTTSNIEEGMSNVLAVQSLGGNRRERRRFSQASRESFKRFRTESFVILSYNQLYSLSLMLGQVVFFIVMAGRVIEGTFTAGDYFVVTVYFFQIYATSGAWGHMYTEWQRNIAGMRRVFFLMDLQAEKTHAGGVELPRISDGIVMDNVGFTYPDGRRALRNVSLKAQYRRNRCLRRANRCGQDESRLPGAGVPGGNRRHGVYRWNGPQGCLGRQPPGPGFLCFPGDSTFLGFDPGQHPLREDGRFAGGGRAGGSHRGRPRVHHGPPRRIPKPHSARSPASSPSGRNNASPSPEGFCVTHAF